MARLKMRTQLTIIVIGIASASIGSPQQLSSKLSPRKGELAYTVVLQKSAAEIEQRLGFRVSSKGSIAELKFQSKMRYYQFWIPNPGLVVRADSTTGKLISVFNMQRAYEQGKGINRTGKVRFKSAVEWERYLVQFGRRAGLPVARIEGKVSYTPEGVRKDANKAGSASAWLLNSSGKRVGVLHVDSQDGVLVNFVDIIAEQQAVINTARGAKKP